MCILQVIVLLGPGANRRLANTPGIGKALGEALVTHWEGPSRTGSVHENGDKVNGALI